VKAPNFLKRLFFGLTLPQQYVCISADNFSHTLHTTFSGRSTNHLVDCKHVLLGYKPVIICMSEHDIQHSDEELCLSLTDRAFDFDGRWKGYPADLQAIARLELKRMKRLEGLAFYEATFGKHVLVSSFHQRANELKLKLKKTKVGNIDLDGNLHDRVRIAYSLPRIIALVTVSDGLTLNVFPTDLHGALGNDLYVSSLRIGGKAQQQVDRMKQMVISEVDSAYFAEVYLLGKNHMKDMADIGSFPTRDVASEKLAIPVPAYALRYFELNIINSFDTGVHRIYISRVINRAEVKKGKTLAHIHQYYAQWRMNNGMATDYLWRPS
jgi:flavin reductase (DIM6/NTAB) family NADH-FMN oxidoreductase RutF